MELPIHLKILKHLHDENIVNENQVIINNFLEILWDKNSPNEIGNLERIKYALDKLNNRGYITISNSPEHLSICENKLFGDITRRVTLDDVAVQVSLTHNGYDYIVNELRNRKQDEINETTKQNSTAQKESVK